MTVYRAKGRRTFTYDFVFDGQRYFGNTKQTREVDAKLVESQLQLKLRQAAGGVAIIGVDDTPRFQDWFEVYADHVRRPTSRITRPDRIDSLIAGALEFWGAPPEPGSKRPVVDGAPYYDLRLGDPVRDPSWILKWEDWLAQPHHSKVRGSIRWSGQTKNQYRSLINQAVKLAMRPAWRLKTHMQLNPFADTERDRPEGRVVSLERDELLTIIACGSFHLRIACALAMLSPKLREGNILALRFDEHFSLDMSYITVHQHKTRRSSGRPLVVYVPEQARRILTAAKRESKSGFVVEYQGKPVKELRGAVRGAVERAAAVMPQLRYGRAHENGITFHTLRHTASTLMVDLGIGPDERKGVVGHARIDTQMLYTHLKPRHEVAAQEKLSAHLPMEALVMQTRRRAPRAGDVKIDGPQDQPVSETLGKAVTDAESHVTAKPDLNALLSVS